jgi:protoporphyrinogen oxidase
MHVVVLGAGLAGLSAAYQLTRSGCKVTVIEREQHVGGMATSFQVDGHWLDHGPHRFYSRDRKLIAHLYEVLDDEIVVRQRASRIHLCGRFFDYPLRMGNVLRNLPVSLLLRSVWDYLLVSVRERFAPTPDDNFEQWVTKRFGRTLYKLFFGTYTEKAWGMDPKLISSDWASQRISQRSLLETIRTTILPPKSGELRSLVSEFYYPKRGGIGALARAYARKIEAAGGSFELNTEVLGMRVDGQRVSALQVRGPDGTRELQPDYVVSTLPLPLLLKSVSPPLPAPSLCAADALDYIAIVFVYLECARPTVTPDHWIYLPEKHLATHRVSEFKNFSDDASPGESSALCCEITCRVGDATWNMELAEAADVAISDLLAAGLIEPGSTRPLALRRLKHAYPVYDLEYKRHLKTLRAASKRWTNFTTTGRQGLFRYNNMDHSIAMGQKAARSAMKGIDSGADKVASSQEYFG